MHKIKKIMDKGVRYSGMSNALNEKIFYDKYGRMLYHPSFHHNHGKAFTESELEYLCKFSEYDDIKTLAFALGRTEPTIVNKLSSLKKSGLYNYYKNLGKEW